MADTITVEAITRRRKRFRLRGRIVWPLLILALAVGGYGYLQTRTTATAVIRYTTTEVKPADITVTVTAVGTVQPIQQVDVGSLISGTISEVDVAVNDTVSKGQVLARLDTSSLEAELARDLAMLLARKAEVEDALATQEAAIATLDRTQKIHDKGLNSNEELAVAKTGDQAHPVFCLCERSLLPHLTGFLAAGGRKIDRWYASLKIVEVSFDDVTAAFSNINSPQELAAFEQIPPVA